MGRRKNILLLGMDDAFAYWRYRAAFGAELKAPNLDRISAVSSVFDAAYCQVPVCGPSRASAMSGMAPHDTGVFDNYTNIFEVMTPEQMWQFRLRQDGYYCSTAGKIHHGYRPLPPEIHDVLYSHPASHVFFGPPRNAPHVKHGGITGGAGTTDPRDDAKYYDARSANHAIRFLQDYDGDAPFYREAGFHHPHLPYRTPDRFKTMYDIDAFIQPQDWAGGFDLSAFTANFMQENMETAGAVDYWKASVRNYFSAYSHVDYHIGRIWDALKASRHADNTIVVVFSDHGFHLGDKNRFRKFTLWEEATRVPFIVHDPDQPGRVIDDPVALLDLGPTVLDYAGVRPMRHSPGKSVRPLVEGGRDPDRAVPTFWYGSASIRKGRWRTTLYQDGSAEFHDVIDDPWLNRNLAGKDLAYEPMRQALHETCRDYGLVIVEAGENATEAASYYSLHQGAASPAELPTNGLVTVGGVAPDHASPGYRRQFATLSGDGTMAVAPGVRELLFASDASGGVEKFGVTCNDDGNRIAFLGGHRRFDLDITGGMGGDTITASHDSLSVRLGPGDNLVHAGVSDGVIWGGTGSDVINCHAGNNEVHGGAGDSTITGGTGNDTIYSGQGDNLIVTGPGDNEVTVEGGRNRILCGEGNNRLVFRRAERPQYVEGFDTGEIDISDWIGMGPPVLAREGNGVALTCGTERVMFTDSDYDKIEAAITGAEKFA